MNKVVIFLLIFVMFCSIHEINVGKEIKKNYTFMVFVHFIKKKSGIFTAIIYEKYIVSKLRYKMS